MFKSKTNVVLSSVLASVSVAAMVAVPASAQSRGDRIAERRAAVEQRLQGLQDTRPERVEQRTAVLNSMSTVTPEQIEARLSDREEQIITRLFQAEPEWITLRLNNAGAAAEAVLSEVDLARLTDEQQDALLAGAARAAVITEEEVEALVLEGVFAVEEFFDNADPAYVATALNEIGAEALDLQDVLQQYAGEVRDRVENAGN